MNSAINQPTWFASVLLPFLRQCMPSMFLPGHASLAFMLAIVIVPVGGVSKKIHNSVQFRGGVLMLS